MDCPDAGRCHHACVERCWRVRNAGPITGTFPGDVWPEHVKAEHSLAPMSAGDLTEMLAAHEADDLPLRAITPHGSFSFDIIGATWEGGYVHLRLRESVRACPECGAGKCGNCNGEAWDTTADEPTHCPCSLLAHPARTA